MTVAEKTQITAAEQKGMMDRGEEFTLLDVRNDDEFARWRIEGRHTPPTVHIPLLPNFCQPLPPYAGK